jgi:hypothetical protein
MTLRDILSSGLVLQSIGIVGLPLVSQKAAPAEPVSARPPKTQTQDDPRRDRFREQHAVRVIDSKDEGLGMAHVSPGTYGFTYAPTAEAPLFAKRAYQGWEVHKAPDGTVHLIGFVSKPDGALIEAGKAKADVKLYPEPYGDATEIVSLPVERIRAKRQPGREDGNVLMVAVTA